MGVARACEGSVGDSPVWANGARRGHDMRCTERDAMTRLGGTNVTSIVA